MITKFARLEFELFRNRLNLTFYEFIILEALVNVI